MTRRVLVVDDDPTVRDVLSTLLSFDGLDVVTASDGRSALDIAKDVHPDVVILDVGMPAMDGLEVCRRLKEQQPHSRVVMVTGKAADTDEIAGVNAGADAYLRKPFSPLALLDVVEAGR